MTDEPMIPVPLSKVPTRVLLENIFNKLTALEAMMTDSTADVQQILDLVNQIGASVSTIDASTSETVTALEAIAQALDDGAETAAIQELVAAAQDVANRASTEAADAANTASTATGLIAGP